MMNISIRQSTQGWQWLATCAVLLGVAASPSATQAALQQMQVVAVGVDRSSAAASEKALEYAKKRGVYLATRKLGVADPAGAVAKISPEAMAQILRGASVLQSRREGDTTYAEVNVTIVDEALRRALNLPEQGSIETEKAATHSRLRGVLLMPVYVTPARAYLWETENQLQEPLSAEIRRQAHGAVLLPAGDFQDLRLIDHRNALSVTAQELEPMFARYGVSEIIIAVLTSGAASTADPDSVLLRRLTPKTSRNEVLEVKPESAEEKLPARLQRTVTAIATATTEIAASTANEDRAKLDAATKIPVGFVFTTPRELASMQATIRAIPGVLLLELPAIALKDMRGTIYTTGDKAALHAALSKQGVRMTEKDGGWMLSLR